ncbi:MAG: 3-dehydroquinate synthase [Enterobacterales bacterium]|nr:3-dehydroquinate synthase [Enterobacterales bacterium]
MQLQVDLNENSYPIHIEADSLNQLNTLLSDLPDKTAIITNQTIADLYLEQVKSQLQHTELTIILIPDSETSKSLHEFERIMAELLAQGFNRSSLLIALGGGVVGDLTGFVAACLHRGCRFVQIPTTLLAQVDSSVGGKTGINHSIGKNLIGAFYQPEAVIIDTNTLKTLDTRQFSAGMAEVIKYGYIDEASFIPWLQKNKAALKALEPKALQHTIHFCCNLKASVVAADEKERGMRMLLNYGHTFGHAIEQVAGYGEWLHGEAVAVGMLMAATMAKQQGFIAEDLASTLREIIIYFDLPTQVAPSMSAAKLTSAMLKDKKNLEQTLRLILPKALGHSAIYNWQDLNYIQNLWCEFGASKSG